MTTKPEYNQVRRDVIESLVKKDSYFRIIDGISEDRVKELLILSELMI